MVRPRLPLILLSIAALVACEDRSVSVAPTPVQTLSERAGSGPQARAGDLVTISYRVVLPDGREVLRDGDYRFQLRRGTVIEAIDEAVEGMRGGGRRVVDAPPHKHWGSAGYGDGEIPPHSRLRIEVELLDVN
jgi:FKBP-type peptidyl-prolyl cis-trans isomerase